MITAGATAPDFTLNDHRGRPFRLSSLRGKTVVLHFWSRDCPPCIQELAESLPAFDELIRGRTDIALVLVGVDLVKPAGVLHAAYNDAAGVTAAFNRNMLRRINRELGVASVSKATRDQLERGNALLERDLRI